MREAYEEGRSDYLLGLAYDQCPYTGALAVAWSQGWEDAADDYDSDDQETQP